MFFANWKHDFSRATPCRCGRLSIFLSFVGICAGNSILSACFTPRGIVPEDDLTQTEMPTRLFFLFALCMPWHILMAQSIADTLQDRDYAYLIARTDVLDGAEAVPYARAWI